MPRITWISSRTDGPVTSRDQHSPRILGINPWIYDFAAYNLWSRPVGLLACLEMLRRTGCTVSLLDCLEASWSDVPWPEPSPDGSGRLPKLEVPKPVQLEHVPRRFSRYGLPMHTVREALTDLDPPPDLVVITTLMTYWYPGARAASELVRTIWPDTPVVLGGVYATACPEHAESLDSFDLILSGPLEAEDNWRSLWRLLKSEPPALPEDAGLTFFRQGYPSPQYSFLLASRGCPLSCTYCASGILYPGLARRDPENVIDEAARDWQRGARDFAFFDDALLLAPQLWLEELLACLPARLPGVRLHAPNALHVRALDSRTCQLLKAAGLSTIRLGLETANFASRPDSKLSREEWDAGLRNLFAAGFTRRQIGAYILFGLPGQDFNDVHQAAAFAWSYGIQPHVAEYSPIPGSGLFSEAERCSDYPLSEEPLFQNSSVWPCVPGGFSWSARQHLRSLLSSARPKGG